MKDSRIAHIVIHKNCRVKLCYKIVCGLLGDEVKRGTPHSGTDTGGGSNPEPGSVNPEPGNGGGGNTGDNGDEG